MIIFIFSYMISISFVIILTKRYKYKTKPILNAHIFKNGIYFTSHYRHFINISNAKMLVISNQIFLKNKNKKLFISNIKNYEIKNNKLYFTANGKVEILFDAKDLYQYFNLSIHSKKFDLYSVKHRALQDILYHPFKYEQKQNFKFFMKIIRNILNIKICQNQIIISANAYKLPFAIFFKLNGKIHKLNFSFK